jgi:photosystem II stability/assembly factor-like uncharacterized protein
MKKIFTLLFFAALLLSACGPNVSTFPPATSPELVIEATPTAIQTDAALAPQSTALPAVVEAPIIEAPSIINIQMLDEVYGWAVTEENIIRTNDGGVTWYDVTPANLADAGYLVYPDFLDADHAWVQFPDMNKYPNGGTLYRTTDGGLTWESFSTPFSGGSINFVDQNNGWMMADLGVGAGSMAVSVFQTSDGGKTWSRTYTNDPNLAEASDTLPLGGIKNMIVPVNADTAWIGGVVYAPGQTYFFRSEDGGKTWFNINLVLPANTAESEISVQGIVFISSTEGLLALRIQSETPQTIVYITEDGGNTWVQSSVSFDGYGILETPSASEMIFYTADQFYVTSDTGATIQQVTPNIKFGDTITDLSFANSKTGWAVVLSPDNRQTLYKTTDGAATWTALIP